MKKTYLLKSKLLYYLYLFYLGTKYKYFTKKNSYSQFGEDLVIDNFFSNFVGTYVDIGCFHPIKYSNTALFHKKGWSGVNIDLNETSISLFNACRKNDNNIVACLSDKIEEVEIYLDSEFSALNSMYLFAFDISLHLPSKSLVHPGLGLRNPRFRPRVRIFQGLVR